MDRKPRSGRGATDVVHQDIDPLAGLPNQAGWPCRIRRIYQHNLYGARSRELVQIIGGFPGAHGHSDASRGQPAHDSEADPSAPACDDDRPASIQPQIHCLPSFRSQNTKGHWYRSCSRSRASHTDVGHRAHTGNRHTLLRLSLVHCRHTRRPPLRGAFWRQVSRHKQLARYRFLRTRSPTP